ncbi:THO complex subunit 5A isoform X1 [Actinidia eriantha]|uniref:THO complex subunit 5A isoform X1 n=1 Tax=Actinidia eriantha TaxID=165200 RepID=UPI002583C4B5|nr:THO complex subunit 5A isoform X1 [Actinidia eriantha]
MEVTMEDGEVVEAEVAELAPQRKIERSAYDMLQQSKASVEEIVAQMISIKREGKPKSELRELVTQMFLNFVTLRQANRSILLEEDRVKAETERAKAPVDFTTLQLHNLMYEKNHYVKAIKACRDFKSKHPDIQLVPEEEFFSDAPEDIKSSVISNDSAHNLMLKRLNFELFQRKELCKLHEKLEQQKQKLANTIANRKKFLSSLPSHLKSLKKASLPVQHQLGVLHTKKLKQHHLAELLPPPLYVIYSQFLAQKEAFGENIDMEIVGSVKDAQTFARQQATKDPGISTNVENSKFEDDAPEEDDDGQRRRKRPKKVPGKENLDQTGIYQAHPLKIILHIHDDDNSEPKSAKLITLKFEYLLKLNVVCVGIEGSNEGPENNILCNLFPDDTGLELPHQSAKLRVGDALTFDERRTSRPYRWTQHLAGIDFLPELSPLLIGDETPASETAKNAAVMSGLSLYRQQNRVQTVVQRIRSRKKAQLALAEQLDLLSKLKWSSLTCESVPWALHMPLCSLHGWSQIGSSPNNASSSLLVDVEQGQGPLSIDMNERSDASKEEVENVREDGELPSLVPVSAVVNDAKVTPPKGSDLEHSKRLSLISKSMVSPIGMPKSLSFKKNDDDSEIMLDSESDLDEAVQIDQDTGNAAGIGCLEMVENFWADYGVQEYCLVLTRTVDDNKRNMKLEAKIKVSMEFPLRPPYFTLSLSTALLEENCSERDCSEWYNELRAMEAEVNVHILKLVPLDQDNFILAHQVRFLAMLFDFYMDEGGPGSEKRKGTSVLDVGLCKPVSGRLLARSYRGRDRRKMISWKDSECAPGYPY